MSARQLLLCPRYANDALARGSSSSATEAEWEPTETAPAFVLEKRLQCTVFVGVRYSVDAHDTIMLSVRARPHARDGLRRGGPRFVSSGQRRADGVRWTHEIKQPRSRVSSLRHSSSTENPG